MSSIDSLITLIKEQSDTIKAELSYTASEAESIKKKIEILKQANKSNSTLDKGSTFEELIKEIFMLKNIYEIKKNIRTSTNEIDLLIMPTSHSNMITKNLYPQIPLTSIILECKNYKQNLGVTWVGKFASLLSHSSLEIGFLVSLKPLAGRGKWDSAKGLVKKVSLRENIRILHFTLDDFLNLEGDNLLEIIMRKINSLDLDIDYPKFEEHDLKNHYPTSI